MLSGGQDTLPSLLLVIASKDEVHFKKKVLFLNLTIKTLSVLALHWNSCKHIAQAVEVLLSYIITISMVIVEERWATQA